MRILICDEACGYEEHTCAPRQFIGDQCPSCLKGHMTPKDPPINHTGYCRRCGGYLHGQAVCICGVKDIFYKGGS